MRQKRDEPPLLEPKDRAGLRAWLEENHTTSGGVTLVIGKKGNRVTSLTYDDAVEEGLCFGWIDSTTHRLDDDRYTIRFTPRRHGTIWARSNKRRVERLMAEGLMRPAGVAAVLAAQTDGSWNMLDEVDDMVMPPDLVVALAAAPGATEGFTGLSGSAQRMTLYWIVSAKRPETRARRIAETVEAAIQNRPPRS